MRKDHKDQRGPKGQMVKPVLSVQMEKRAKLDHQVLPDIPEVQGTKETRGLRVATAFLAQKENEARMG